MATIRRYANRKYYHVEGHRYVNLRDISGLVRSGEAVRVYEHPAGQEITSVVLAQIIAQEQPAAEEGTAPAVLDSLLASIVRWGYRPVEDAGRLLLGGLGLPTRAQWRRLEREVSRLEALLDRLLDEVESPML